MYVGLDIGTSSCKAEVINEFGECLKYSKRKYSMITDKDGNVEISVNEVLNNVKSCLKELNSYSDNIEGISVSGFGESFVILDSNDKALNNFILYSDNRCKDIDKIIIKDLGIENIFNITGAYPNQSYSICKLLWIKKNCPKMIKNGVRIFFVVDYFTYILTGKRVVDYATASKTLMFDIKKYDWDNSLLEYVNITRNMLSEVKEPGTYVGKINDFISKEICYPSDIKVYLGSHDQCAATLGAGAYNKGDVVISDGSTESINIVVDSSIFNYKEILINNKMCVEPYMNKNLYIIPIGFLTYGNALEWYINTFENRIDFSNDKDFFNSLEKEKVEKTNLMFFPFLSEVNIMNPDLIIDGGFLGVKLNTKKYEFYESIMQGLNFETKINLKIIDKLEININKIKMVGGFTNSNHFVQMKSDILKRKIYTLNYKESCTKGLFLYKEILKKDNDNSTIKVIEKMCKIDKIFEPKYNYDVEFSSYEKKRNEIIFRRNL